MKLKVCNGCGKERPIFKNVTIDGERYKFCASCANNKSIVPTATPKQIKKRSDKKVIEDRLYTILRNKYQSEHPNCEINSPTCTGIGIEIHHTEGRGIKTNDVSTWLNVCRNCHNFTHLNPEVARENGWLK